MHPKCAHTHSLHHVEWWTTTGGRCWPLLCNGLCCSIRRSHRFVLVHFYFNNFTIYVFFSAGDAVQPCPCDVACQCGRTDQVFHSNRKHSSPEWYTHAMGMYERHKTRDQMPQWNRMKWCGLRRSTAPERHKRSKRTPFTSNITYFFSILFLRFFIQEMCNYYYYYCGARMICGDNVCEMKSTMWRVWTTHHDHLGCKHQHTNVRRESLLLRRT